MPIRFAETVSTESVSVSIAKAFDLLIFAIQFLSPFSSKMIS